MNILILSPLDPIFQVESVTYSNTNNHMVFYSLEISHELQRLGFKVRIKSILDICNKGVSIETVGFGDEDIILAIGYFDNLMYVCEQFKNSENLKSKTLFTMSTATILHEQVHTHFVMKQQTFFNVIHRDHLVWVELPIPKTLKMRDVTDNHYKKSICVDGPARIGSLQHLSPNMNNLYSSILETVNPNEICQLSPFAGYYSEVGLSQFQPPKEVEEIPYLNIPNLELFLSSIDHFIITICESYGAIVADCLSTNTLVHYPIEPLVPNKSLHLVGDIPNCIPFGSTSELSINIQKYKFQSPKTNCPNTYVFEYVAEYIAKNKVGGI